MIQIMQGIRRLFLREVTRYWSTKTSYKDLEVSGKYKKPERSQRSITIKVSSVSPTRLSPDNYAGEVHSYCGQVYLPDFKVQSLDWVLEDSAAIQQNGGVFPSAPGLYVLEAAKDGEIWVNPLLSQESEPLLFVSGESELSYAPYPGSVRLYHPSGRAITDFSVVDRKIVVSSSVESAIASYKYAVPKIGPWTVPHPHVVMNRIIPGVRIAFDDIPAEGDTFAVAVYPSRVPAFTEYRGRSSVSVDLDITGRDPDEAAYILDKTSLHLFTTFRRYVSDLGIDLESVSYSESEDVYDETGDDYFFGGTISVELNSEWVIYEPLEGGMISANLRFGMPNSGVDLAFLEPRVVTRYGHERIS